MILLAVKEIKRSGARLQACYASMYFAALRPEEAVNLRESNLKLPEPEWNTKEEKREHGWGSAVSHAETLAAQARQVSGWAEQASASAETSIAGITAGEVTGEAVASLHTAHEQMTAAATQVGQAQRELAAAQEQFAATAAAFDTAHAAFQRQMQVAEAYAANPDAGSKQFNTYA